MMTKNVSEGNNLGPTTHLCGGGIRVPERMPSDAELLALHERVRSGDKLAWSELASHLFPWLAGKLPTMFPQSQDLDFLVDAVTQALEKYRSNPDGYDPKKGGIGVYLLWVSRGCLANAFRKVIRRRHREAHAVNEKRWILAKCDSGDGSDAQPNQKLQEIMNVLSWRDQSFITTFLWEGAATDGLADVLGLTETSKKQIQSEVKKNRDRIIKKLKRFAAKRA